MSLSLIWFLAAIVFLAIELLLPHLVLLFFGLGALGACLASTMDVSLSVQIILFLVLALVSLTILRTRLSRIFGGRSSLEEQASSNPVLGAQGTVTKALAPNLAGEVEVNGSFWRAYGTESLEQGARVTVVSEMDSLILLVRPLASERNDDH